MVDSSFQCVFQFPNLAIFCNRNLTPTALLRRFCRRTKFHWWYIGWLFRKLDAEIVVVPYPFGPTINHEDIIPPLVKIYTEFMDAADERGTIVAGDRYTFWIP